MKAFMTETLTDLRCGRQSWRVPVAFHTPAFPLAAAFGVAQRVF